MKKLSTGITNQNKLKKISIVKIRNQNGSSEKLLNFWPKRFWIDENLRRTTIKGFLTESVNKKKNKYKKKHWIKTQKPKNKYIKGPERKRALGNKSLSKIGLKNFISKWNKVHNSYGQLVTVAFINVFEWQNVWIRNMPPTSFKRNKTI